MLHVEKMFEVDYKNAFLV